LLASLTAVLRFGFMDDLTLGGSGQAVAEDVEVIMKAGADMGLKLNTSKCELITHPGCRVNDPTLLSFLQIQVTEAELTNVDRFGLYSHISAPQT